MDVFFKGIFDNGLTQTIGVGDFLLCLGCVGGVDSALYGNIQNVLVYTIRNVHYFIPLFQILIL